MVGELAVRFLLGGLIVSAFAVIGEVLQPKRFAGIFGAAPSVALATLGLAFANEGGDYAATAGRSMLAGAAALAVCSLLGQRLLAGAHWPAALVAGLQWVVWLLVALGLWAVVPR